MKTAVFRIWVVFILVATFYPSPGFAQNLTLPEGARGRLGPEFRCFNIQQSVEDNSTSNVSGYYLWDFDYFPDSKRLAVISSEGSVLYDAETFQKLTTRFNPAGGYRSVACSPDGYTMAIGSLYGFITSELINKVPNLQRPTPESLPILAGFPSAHVPFRADRDPVYVPIAWLSPDGYTLVKGGVNPKAAETSRIGLHWSNVDGKSRGMFPGGYELLSPNFPLPGSEYIVSVGFWGSRVASVAENGTILLWDRAKGTPPQRFEKDYQNYSLLRTEREESSLHWSWWVEALVTVTDWRPKPRGTMANVYKSPLDSIHNPANTISLWREWSNEEGDYKAFKKFKGHKGCVWDVVLSQDGEMLASASVDGTIRVWNGRTGHDWMQLRSRTLHFSNMAFSSRTGETLAVGKWDGTIQLYSTFLKLKGYSWAPFKGHTGPVTSVAFNPKLPILASASTDGTLRVWNTRWEEELYWNIEGGATPTSIKSDRFNTGSAPLTSVAFSPDGRKLAVGMWDKHVVLLEWDGLYHVGEPLGVSYELIWRRRHAESVTSVAFSPDGQTLAASGSGGTIRLWSIGPHGRTDKLKGHTDSVFKVMFSPDGRTLASGSDDGTVLLWDHEPAPEWDPPDPPKPADPSKAAEDVNGDGQINVVDLALVAANFGNSGEIDADVNQDGVVDGVDAMLVEKAMDEGAAAPAMWNRDLELLLTKAEVARWLTQARQLNRTGNISQWGIRFLEQLLAALTPQETILLANYPNPFNPETWIPYQLAVPANVTVRIHAMDGSLIRTLALGYREAGIYQSRSRAAYWDGKNELGEPVASGAYFYTLTAGEFSATRKLLTRK